MPGQSSTHGSNPLLDRIDGPVASFTADAHDHEDVYGEVATRHPGAAVIVPPRSFAFVKPVRTRSEWAGGLLFPRRLVAMPGSRLSYGRATSPPGLSSAVPGVLARSLASDVWKLCAFQGPPSAL